MNLAATDESPPSVFPLQECEGDCDVDSDCSGTLICYQRSAGDDTVPGCSGRPTGENDYCIKPPTVIGGGVEATQRTSEGGEEANQPTQATVTFNLPRSSDEAGGTR